MWVDDRTCVCLCDGNCCMAGSFQGLQFAAFTNIYPCLKFGFSIFTIRCKQAQSDIPCSAKFWWGKTLANYQSFYEFGEENVGEFTIGNINYFSEPGIWLGKILANGVHFAKFIKVSSHQNFVLHMQYSCVTCEKCFMRKTVLQEFPTLLEKVECRN